MTEEPIIDTLWNLNSNLTMRSCGSTKWKIFWPLETSSTKTSCTKWWGRSSKSQRRTTASFRFKNCNRSLTQNKRSRNSRQNGSILKRSLTRRWTNRCTSIKTREMTRLLFKQKKEINRQIHIIKTMEIAWSPWVLAQQRFHRKVAIIIRPTTTSRITKRSSPGVKYLYLSTICDEICTLRHAMQIA